jgi:hypothetical protein
MFCDDKRRLVDVVAVTATALEHVAPLLLALLVSSLLCLYVKGSTPFVLPNESREMKNSEGKQSVRLAALPSPSRQKRAAVSSVSMISFKTSDARETSSERKLRNAAVSSAEGVVPLKSRRSSRTGSLCNFVDEETLRAEICPLGRDESKSLGTVSAYTTGVAANAPSNCLKKRLAFMKPLEAHGRGGPVAPGSRSMLMKMSQIASWLQRVTTPPPHLLTEFLPESDGISLRSIVK